MHSVEGEENNDWWNKELNCDLKKFIAVVCSKEEMKRGINERMNNNIINLILKIFLLFIIE